jgi:hypothetical protein
MEGNRAELEVVLSGDEEISLLPMLQRFYHLSFAQKILISFLFSFNKIWFFLNSYYDLFRVSIGGRKFSQFSTKSIGTR